MTSLPFGSRKDKFMSKNETLSVVQNLQEARDKYIKTYHELEGLPEFKDLSRSARGNGLIFQYSESVRDAICQRAKIAGKELRSKIYSKCLELHPDILENLHSAMSDAEAFLETPEKTTDDELKIKEMLFSLKSIYLPT